MRNLVFSTALLIAPLLSTGEANAQYGQVIKQGANGAYRYIQNWCNGGYIRGGTCMTVANEAYNFGRQGVIRGYQYGRQGAINGYNNYRALPPQQRYYAPYGRANTTPYYVGRRNPNLPW
jgi:hypothetical protein